MPAFAITQGRVFYLGEHMHVFITGVAGFIGSTAAKMLLDQGHQVSGIDNLNDYYDPALKQARLNKLQDYEQFSFTQGGIEEAVF